MVGVCVGWRSVVSSGPDVGSGWWRWRREAAGGLSTDPSDPWAALRVPVVHCHTAARHGRHTCQNQQPVRRASSCLLPITILLVTLALFMSTICKAGSMLKVCYCIGLTLYTELRQVYQMVYDVWCIWCLWVLQLILAKPYISLVPFLLSLCVSLCLFLGCTIIFSLCCTLWRTSFLPTDQRNP